MPTECERTTTIANTSQNVPQTQQLQQQQQQQQQQQHHDQQLQAEQLHVENEEAAAAAQLEFHDDMEGKELNGGKMSTSQQTSTTSATNGHNGSSNNTNGVGKKTSIISPDPTPYVTKARVTRPTPPPPSYNPMQFVQIKPCNLYQTAQEQLKKAEEVKKIKEIKKEEPEDWQNNLDNWKSSRRKRVEHIIDRVVEVKKLELEEHDRTRRKSKTFSEMIEERGERGPRGRVKLASLAVYNEDESNDLSDLGIGTSSASGKSSQSEDYDNNSVLSDNAELDKAIFENNQKPSSIPAREYISSPGYDTSSSTAPGSSPDPCEYTYEGAIQDYKQRVSRASGGSALANFKLNAGNTSGALISKTNTTSSKEASPECGNSTTPSSDTYPTRRGSKIEDRLIGFEVTSPSDSQEGLEKKVDVPKIDISKRKEIFENQNANTEPKSLSNSGGGSVAVPRVTLRDRFKLDESAAGNGEVYDTTLKREVKRLSGDITSIRTRMQNLEQQQNLVNSTNGSVGAGKASNAKLVDIPVPPLKDRLSSLQNAVAKEEVKKAPVALVDARQLEIMKSEEEQRRMKQMESEKKAQVVEEVATKEQVSASSAAEAPIPKELVVKIDAPEEEVDRDDSGIHTADGEIEATEAGLSEQEQQLNAAIAALALEEQQLTEAANAVNQIEAEFAELSTNAVNAIASDLTTATATASAKTTNEQPCEMDFSVSSTNKSLLEPAISSVKSSFELENTSIESSSRSIGEKVANAEKEQQKVNNTVCAKSEQKVLGNNLTVSSPTNLQRKPSNEMVHARNLLRMFKETFKSDIELDEVQEHEVKPIAEPSIGGGSGGAIPKQTVRPLNSNGPQLSPGPVSITGESPQRPQTPTPFTLTAAADAPISTQIFQSSTISPSALSPPSPSPFTQPTSPMAIPQTPPSPSHATRAPTPPPRSSPSVLMSNGFSMIPRAVNPIGKPPMSPKSTRYTVISPVNSPPPARKSADDNPFSINGRVEIFNSKNMNTNPTGKPPTPTMNARKSYVPQLGATTPTSPILGRPPSPMNATAYNGSVGFPKQQQFPTTVTVTALPPTTSPPPASNQMLQAKTAAANAAKSMPGVQVVNEPSHETRLPNVTTVPHSPQQQQQQQQQQHNHAEVVMCAPPVTILNPDELPKPNTVKALSSCFSQDVAASNQPAGKTKPPILGPKPLPRSRIPQTPPQSPTPAKRNFLNSPSAATDATVKEFTKTGTTSSALPKQPQPKPTAVAEMAPNLVAPNADDLKKLSIISDISTVSSDSSVCTEPFETTAQVHSPPAVLERTNELNRAALKPLPLMRNAHNSSNKPGTSKQPTDDPLKPNDSLTPVISVPSQMPTLVACKPNQSTLFKLTTPPASPHSPLSPTDVTLCNNFLNSFEPTNSYLPVQQKSVDESPCDKMDVNELPPSKRPPCTFYEDISANKVKACDESGTKTEISRQSVPPQAQRQHTVEEKICQKIDVNDLPAYDQVPLTGYDEVTAEQVRICDGLNARPPSKGSDPSTPRTSSQSTGSAPSTPDTPTTVKSMPITPISNIPLASSKSNTSRPNSKPNSPIMVARAAHSRALIETCERIIAEERLHSSQIKSALPTHAVAKSSGTPLLQRKSKIPKPIPCCISATDSMNQADQPAKPVLKQSSGPPTPESVDENMIIGRLHVVETQIKVTTSTPPSSPTVTTKSNGSAKPVANQNPKKTKNIFDFLRKNFGIGDDNPPAVAAAASVEEEVAPSVVPPAVEKDVVKLDEIFTVDNSKFYIPSDDVPPPPLPKTPAPVNIEITKTFTTNEIVEEGTSEQDLVQEINEMLDDELNRLTLESGSSINEALELALEAIDKETKFTMIDTTTIKATTKSLNTATSNHQSTAISTTTTTTTDMTTITTNLAPKETTNKTDEEKELKTKQQIVATTHNYISNRSTPNYVPDNDYERNDAKAAEMAREALISQEPIYENISAASTRQVDAEAIRIHSASALNDNNNQVCNVRDVNNLAVNQINQLNNNMNSNSNNNNNNISIDNSNANNVSNSNHNNLLSNLTNISNNNNNSNSNNNKRRNVDTNFIELTNAFANATTITTAMGMPAAATATATTITTTAGACTAATAAATAALIANEKAHASDNNAAITKTTTTPSTATLQTEQNLPSHTSLTSSAKPNSTTPERALAPNPTDLADHEPYYQVPQSSEPYYDAPKHLRPVPLYENIEVFYTGLENSTLAGGTGAALNGNFKLEPPKEKPPPPPIESPPPFDDVDSIDNNTDTWSSDNTYETISSRLPHVNGLAADHPSPPIKRMNSTKRIKKELRNKRSSFLGIDTTNLDDEESYLELTVAPPPDMAQLLQEERRLEKQLYLKAGLCDSSDTGESRDSGVSENHSRQSSEHYTNSSEENDRQIDSPPHSLKSNELVYQNEALLSAVQTPLLQTVKGNCAESWTESATVAAAATKSLTEATATANAKMLSIEEKIREQEEVLRVERELLQLEQEELKRQRENLMLRENMARRELQHGAKMLMSANRRSLQDLNGVGMSVAGSGAGLPLPNAATNLAYQTAVPQYALAAHHGVQQPPKQLFGAPLVAAQPAQQIYANVPNLQQQYYQVDIDYRKSMSDLQEFSKRHMLPPTPPTKPMRAMHVANSANTADELAAQRHSLNAQGYGGSLVKIAAPTAAPRGHTIYSNQQYHHQSTQNLNVSSGSVSAVSAAPLPPPVANGHHPALPGNMSRNTLLALSATPKPKYTDGWVQVQQRKSFDSNLANDPAWLSAYQQKRKSLPEAYHAYNNHWLVQEAEQRRIAEQRRGSSTGTTPVHQQNGSAVAAAGGMKSATSSNGKPLPDSIIQTLTERVQSKGIGERKRFDNYNTQSATALDKSPLHAASTYYQHQHQLSQPQTPTHKRHLSAGGSGGVGSTIAAMPPQTNVNASPAHQQPPQQQQQQQQQQQPQQQDKVLSVSGKKKCSHCGDELGRGAAMIIESLLLFYHINCFKCCVCHVQLGDGLNGTDVRVRNHKLHCQNCYSSDDGIKFSCV